MDILHLPVYIFCGAGFPCRFTKIRETAGNSCKKILHSGFDLQKKCKLLFGRYEGCPLFYCFQSHFVRIRILRIKGFSRCCDNPVNPLVAIGRALQPFPRSKPCMRLSSRPGGTFQHLRLTRLRDTR